MTPGADHAERYAFFSRLAIIENLDEIYTAGWQGIAHWPGRGGVWEVQMPTYFYDIRSISVIGGSENRSVWAVGREGIDKQGNYGDRSHGAVYHLSWPADHWEKMPLPGIEFESGQAFSDILLLDYETVIVVGDRGIIVRGSHDKKLGWVWSKLPKLTDEVLNSVVYHDKILWIVGSGGIVLKSTDKGIHWKKEPVVKNKKGMPVNLRRIRFFNNRGWIFGKDLVLRKATPVVK